MHRVLLSPVQEDGPATFSAVTTVTGTSIVLSAFPSLASPTAFPAVGLP